MSTELHQKVLGFLAGEIVRKEGRQCVGVDLLFAPGGGFRDEEIRKWERADEPELFELARIPDLATLIVEIAEGEADARPPNSHGHRFIVRARQHMGGRPFMSFSLKPAFAGDDSGSLVPSGGGRTSDATIISQHASQLMRTNAQMFDGTIRVLGAGNEALRSENSELRAEVYSLRRENDELRSTRLEREFSVAMQTEKHKMRAAGMSQLLQIGAIITAKMTGGGAPAGAALGGGTGPGASALAGLVYKFGDSLRTDQIEVLMGLLDMGQKAMFLEIMNMVAPADQKVQDPPAATPPPSTPPPSSPPAAE